MDAGGWLHSGDLGRLDAEGYLSITGRIKELLKTAGGENIPPLLIENTIKEELKAVSQAVLIGDRRRFLAVLLTVRCNVDATTGEPTEELDHTALAVARSIGSPAATVAQAIACPRFAAYVEEGLRRANRRAISNAQCVRKWRWLPRDLSVPGGELTATLKLKRSVVHKQYAALVEDMYAAEEGAE